MSAYDTKTIEPKWQARWDEAGTFTAARDESDIEVFYRFPLLPEVDMTVAYQTIYNLGNDPTNDLSFALPKSKDG